MNCILITIHNYQLDIQFHKLHSIFLKRYSLSIHSILSFTHSRWLPSTLFSPSPPPWSLWLLALPYPLMKTPPSPGVNTKTSPGTPTTAKTEHSQDKASASSTSTLLPATVHGHAASTAKTTAPKSAPPCTLANSQTTC